MKKRLKDVLIGILIGCSLMITTPALANTALQQIDVVLNGVNVEVEGNKLDSNSILYNGSTYLPLRTVVEAVGKDVKWDENTMTANIIEKEINNNKIVEETDNSKIDDRLAEDTGEVNNIYDLKGELKQISNLKIHQKDGYPAKTDGVDEYCHPSYFYSKTDIGKYNGYFERNKITDVLIYYDNYKKFRIDNIDYVLDGNLFYIEKSYIYEVILPIIEKEYE